ncbi:nickel-responsive transcriptional regulator NikR [Pseudoroseomonas wenyumeiae]|uniref:Nickel-responsive transcriptional regulator NikR n=1 Tax=Teichococcus wenyumeiae TaxID=2478470 RepID=A0A3A9K4B0_9PROT|nr:nickel-responsive transcriptional regulator NikR [Pseudoroseomonas wenyumeiae]RKK06199.1 nickel-responsive transcriptional regulator NikR [Pseudoroseomonas wenyumeiae]RMI17540.1 nickel-responsive transcriptional regulator NikR [Pseudoroseomonas wenyumeiae]
MQRITISMDDDLAGELDTHMRLSGTSSRSEAVRDLVRRGLTSRAAGPAKAHCFGVVSCAIDQSVRGLAARVPQGRLERHDQTVSALSVPLDHTTSIDVAVMRGHVADISSYAEALFLERGVMHGALSLIPVAESAVHHRHGPGAAHEHTHPRIKSGF